jgi:MFS family permease
MTPLGGWCSDRLVSRLGSSIGRRLVPMFGMALSSVLLLMGAHGFGFAATVALLALALGFLSASEGPYWATAIEASPNLAGSAGGILNTVGNVGGIAAPILTPAVAARFGWEGSLRFASALLILGLMTWFSVRLEPSDKVQK